MPKRSKRSNPTSTVYHTDDTCPSTGDYTAGHCTPPFTRPFTAGDAFTKCHHGNRTDWRSSKPKPLTSQNVTIAIGLAIITVAALLLIAPAELIPNSAQYEGIPIIAEARRQSANILMLLGTQAALLLILAALPHRRILPIWAAIAAALVPFAAALNEMDQHNPAQTGLAFIALAPILIRGISIVPFGKGLASRLAFATAWAIALIGLSALIANTRLGPIIARITGVEAITVALVLAITIGAIIIIIVFLAIGAIAHGRATRPD